MYHLYQITQQFTIIQLMETLCLYHACTMPVPQALCLYHEQWSALQGDTGVTPNLLPLDSRVRRLHVWARGEQVTAEVRQVAGSYLLLDAPALPRTEQSFLWHLQLWSEVATLADER